MFDQIKNYALIGLTITCLFLGLFSHSLLQSKKELENEKRELAAKLKVAGESVKTSNTGTSKDFKDFREKLDSTKKEADKKWTLLVQQKDSEISKLKATQVQKKSELSQMQDLLAKSASPEEKALLQEKITELVAQISTVEVSQKSLECLSLPLPDSAIEGINAFLPEDYPYPRTKDRVEGR